MPVHGASCQPRQTPPKRTRQTPSGIVEMTTLFPHEGAVGRPYLPLQTSVFATYAVAAASHGLVLGVLLTVAET